MTLKEWLDEKIDFLGTRGYGPPDVSSSKHREGYYAACCEVRDLFAKADPAPATDHPKAFAEAILDYTPTVSKSDNRLTFVFDTSEQTVHALDLLSQAINSVSAFGTDTPDNLADIASPDPLQLLAASHAELTQRVEEIEKTLRTLRQGINNRL